MIAGLVDVHELLQVEGPAPRKPEHRLQLRHLGAARGTKPDGAVRQIRRQLHREALLQYGRSG